MTNSRAFVSDTQKSGVIVVYRFFLLLTVLSFLFCLFTQKLNGDFLGSDVTVSNWLLFLLCVASLLPLIFLWRVYRKFTRNTLSIYIKLHGDYLYFFSIGLTLWNILITLLFGVGIMAAEIYSAPLIFKPFIQFSLRLNHVYVALLALFATKSKKRAVILIILLLCCGYLRAGLGVMFYIGFASIIKFWPWIRNFIKRFPIVVIISFFLLPIIVSSLYDFRSSIRNLGDSTKELSSIELLVGKLGGRMSSFSNLVIIAQEPVFFIVGSTDLNDHYFARQAINAIVPAFTFRKFPEVLPLNLLGVQSDESLVSYMLSLPGNLAISAFKGWPSLLSALLTLLLCVYGSFYLYKLTLTPYSLECAFIILVYPSVSGVANEFSTIFFSHFLFLIITLVFNYFYGRNRT